MDTPKVTSSNPLITIGIPVFNTPKEDIERCFISVFEQTYKNLEILVVNDCCTDNTITHINNTATRLHSENKLRIINHNYNQGVSGSRNTILQKAQGEYLYFMDCDDIIENNTIELLLNEAKSNDADSVWGSIKIKSHNVSEEIEYKKFPHLILDGKKDIAEHCRIFGIHWFPVVWNILFKTTLVRDNNLHFQSVGTYDDYIFQFQLLPLLNKVVLIPNFTYCWMIRQGSQSFITGRTFNINHINNAIKAELFIKEFYTLMTDKRLIDYYYPLISAHALYQACYIVKHRKHFDSQIPLSKIKDILSPIMTFKDLFYIKHNRLKLFFFYCLSKCPSYIIPCILRVISKAKWT